MKKILALTLTLASIAFTATTAEASSLSGAIVAPGIAPQIRIRIGPRRHNGWYRRAPVQVTTQTRLVRDGWRVWRETYQVRYLPNGMTQTRLISRVRVR